MCLLSELIQGNARGQYGQRSLCGESAYELRFFLITYNSADTSFSAELSCCFGVTEPALLLGSVCWH